MASKIVKARSVQSLCECHCEQCCQWKTIPNGAAGASNLNDIDKRDIDNVEDDKCGLPVDNNIDNVSNNDNNNHNDNIQDNDMADMTAEGETPEHLSSPLH